MRHILLAVLTALALLLGSDRAHAQQSCPFGVPWCTIGPDGRVIIQPPSQGGGASAGGSAGGQVAPPPVVIDPNIALQAELAARARWDAYFAAEAAARASIRARVSAELHANWRLRWRATANPYATVAPPRFSGGGTNTGMPSLAAAPLGFCAGVWTGPGSPTHAGYCPTLRAGLTDSLALELSPSWFTNSYAHRNYGSLNLHPGLLWVFLQGRYQSGMGAHAYLRGGLDAWIPYTGGQMTPDGFFGGDLGIGVQAMGSGVGGGVELRAQTRRGFGAASEIAETMSSWRAGMELRIFLVLSRF